MIKPGFNRSRSLAEKAEEQQGTLPVAMELSERELAFVAGGQGGDGNGYYDNYHHYHRYDHYHDHRYDHYHGHH